MRQKLLWIAALVVAATPATAQKVFVDYDSSFAFSQAKTFQFVETREDLRDTNPLVHKDVVVALKRYAIEGGLGETDRAPDIYIAYYTADQGNLRLVLSDLDYAYGPSFSPGDYWDGGVGTRTPYSYTFKEGTLIIDVWEAATKLLVWRGIATAAMSKNPGKNHAKLDKALQRIFKRWEKDRGAYLRQLRLYQATQEEQG